MRKLTCIIAGLAVSLALMAAAKPLPKDVRGTVSTPDGKPVAGAVVSDGFQVVTTDSEGK